VTFPALVNSRWRTETGSNYKLLTGRHVNVMSAATTQISGMPDSLPPVRHRPISENSIRYKPEVETVPQTGNTNNLATEIDIDAISVVIRTFLGGGGKVFTGMYADLTRCLLHP